MFILLFRLSINLNMSKLPTPAFLNRQIRRTRSLIDINNSLYEKDAKRVRLIKEKQLKTIQRNK